MQIHTKQIDKLSYNLLSLSLVILGCLNLVFFMAPFVIFKGWQTFEDNGYQILTWFGTSFSEGPIIATCALIIFVMSIVVTIYGLYTFILKDKVEIYRHMNIIRKGMYVHFGVVIINMIVIFLTIESMHFRLMNQSYELPYGGWGIQSIFWINILVPTLIRIFVQIVQDRLTQREPTYEYEQ